MANKKSIYKELLSKTKSLAESGKGKKNLNYQQRRKLASELSSKYANGDISKTEINSKLNNAFGIKKKQTLYQKFSKEFTTYNNSLDKSKQLPISVRRGIIKKLISDNYYGVGATRVSKSDINELLGKAYKKQIRSEKNAPNLLIVDFGVYALVNWFDIDALFANVLPKGVFGKVSAGDFGNTEIFNTNYYSSSTTGVDKIIENIREATNNTSSLVFVGEIDVRPNKKDDGNPDSYYLHMVLNVDEKPVIEMREEPIEISNKRKIKGSKNKRSVNREIELKIKELKKVKDRNKRARTRIKKDLQVLDTLLKKKKLSKVELIASVNVAERINNEMTRYKKDGRISKKYFQLSKEQLKKNVSKLGKKLK